MSSDVFLIRLKSVVVNENGKKEENVEGANIIEAKLIYPKEGIPALTTIRPISLKDKELFDCSNLPMKKNVLFKQSFDGDSELEFNICAEVRMLSIEKAIFKMLGIVAKAAVNSISGIGEIATAAITSFTDSIFSFTPESTIILGSGTIPINKDIGEGERKVPLLVPEDVEIVKLVKDSRRNRTYLDRLPLRKGAPNGEIIVDIIKL